MSPDMVNGAHAPLSTAEVRCRLFSGQPITQSKTENPGLTPRLAGLCYQDWSCRGTAAMRRWC